MCKDRVGGATDTSDHLSPDWRLEPGDGPSPSRPYRSATETRSGRQVGDPVCPRAPGRSRAPRPEIRVGVSACESVGDPVTAHAVDHEPELLLDRWPVGYLHGHVGLGGPIRVHERSALALEAVNERGHRLPKGWPGRTCCPEAPADPGACCRLLSETRRPASPLHNVPVSTGALVGWAVTLVRVLNDHATSETRLFPEPSLASVPMRAV